jgi:hypothetical protein
MPKQWGALLSGHERALCDWREMLKPPFDPWVEVHGPDHVLRSESLDGLTSMNEVRDRVLAHIERLNGAMSIARHSQLLQFAGVAELRPDRESRPTIVVHRTVFATGGTYALSGAHGVSMTLGLDGKPMETPPKRSDVQSWAAIADGDDLLEDALIYFGRASLSDPEHPPTFWFDIYKALECLMQRAGGETPFISLGWAPPEDVKRLKRTANWARHARRKFPKPSPATTEQEARDLMSRLFRKAFEAAHHV